MKTILNILILPLICQLILQSDGGSIGSQNLPRIPDKELEDISEFLLSKDVPNEKGSVNVYLQNKVYTNSPSTNPLLAYNENPGKREPQTYTLLRRLFREFESNGSNLDKLKNDFLNAVIETDVMKETINFLNRHGNAWSKNDLKSYLNKIWFTSYKRGKGVQSSGFKHVFMAELKDNTVQGLHNWLYFLEQEKLGTLKYIGWAKSIDFRGYPSSIVKIKFQWNGGLKPSGSLFVGTSPELELALYSLCFIYRPQQNCPVSLGNVPVTIKTHTFTWNREDLIGSAYPTI